MASRGDPKLAEAFGQRVRDLRKHGASEPITQERLAEAMGVTPGYIGQIERGITNVTLLTVTRVAIALDVDPADLVRGLRPTDRRARPARKAPRRS